MTLGKHGWNNIPFGGIFEQGEIIFLFTNRRIVPQIGGVQVGILIEVRITIQREVLKGQ